MEWRIPLSDIDFDQQEVDVVVGVLRSKWLTMGEVTQEFETVFARYLGVKHAFAVSSGTAALHIAHQAIGVGEGDEVICPSLTFVATANSILYTGALPVFADITSLDNFNISPDSILEKISPQTKAVTIVHYGGYPCDMDRIMQIARSHNLYVVEDAAHAPGAGYKGRKCGTIGDIGCFSFFSNKNMITGEGGMIVTDDDELAEKIRLMRSHGMTTLTLQRHKGHAYSYDVVSLGYNYRIDEIRSAIGLVQLGKLDTNNEKRKQVVSAYMEELDNVPQISLPFKSFAEKSSHHIFPVLLSEQKDRGVFMDRLKQQGIQTSIHYPPVHLFRYYRDIFGGKECSLSLTEEVGRIEVTLPLYPTMTKGDVKYVANAVRESLAS